MMHACTVVHRTKLFIIVGTLHATDISCHYENVVDSFYNQQLKMFSLGPGRLASGQALAVIDNSVCQSVCMFACGWRPLAQLIDKVDSMYNIPK